MNLIYFLLKTSWVSVAIAALAGSLSGFGQTFLIATINQAVSKDNPNLEHLAWNFILLVLITFSVSLLAEYLLISLSQSAVHKLRLRLSRWILSCPLRHLEELGSNKLLATLTDDVEAISTTVFSIPFLFADLAIILGCFVYLGLLSWIAFTGTLASIAIVVIFINFLQAKALSTFKLAREEQDVLFKHFRTITEGIKELKLHSHRREAFIEEELEITTASSRDFNITSHGISAIASTTSSLLFFLIVGTLVFCFPLFTEVNTSVLSGYVLVLIYLQRPYVDILRMLPRLNRASVALQKIDRIGLSLKSSSENLSTNHSSSKPSFSKIELTQITHTYYQENQNSSFTFGPINLTLYPGELIFIVGGNGSGKSTLAKLITGLYIPEAGKISQDGNPITDQNREAYRQLFATVFSDFYLFERILGISQKDLDAKALKYLKQLQLEHKVYVKDGTLSTINLSQGQRKRLALLTAYLEDRPIYLFDEWASDQDPSFREVFYKQILSELKQRGKTVLVISHDDRYFHLADRLIKLDYGKIV